MKALRDATLASLRADADKCLRVGLAFSDARACLEGIGYRAFAEKYRPTAQAYRVKDRFAIIRIRLDRPGGQVERWDCLLHSPSGRF